ncbi:uncharacterized protein [Phyllobates terribilis]|uniref:uncharacterized protein n=1 Tax=Phyllobates terribilis TaxID=111132 RepID=UPI003CCAAC18
MASSSGEAIDEMADDVSPQNLPVYVPGEQGGDVESDHSSLRAYDRFPDLKSSRQQELPQGTPESVENLILYFNEKLGLANKGEISDDAAKKEVGTPSEIFEEILVPEAENDEEFEACTKDGTKQELGLKEAICEPSEYHVESKALLTTIAVLGSAETPHSNKWMEKSSFSEELNECRNPYRRKSLDESIEGLDKVGEVALNTATQEGAMMETIKIKNEENIPNENILAIDVYKESKATIPCEDITKKDIVDSKVSAKLLEIVPEDVLISQDEPIQEYMESYSGLNICADDVPLVLGHVDVVEMEDSFVSVAGTLGEKGPASEDCRDIESIRAEDFSRHEETGSGEVSTEYLLAITSESEEDSTSFNITECGEMAPKDFEEVIHVDEDIVLTEGVIKEVGDAALSILTQEGTMPETIQIADEIVPLLTRDVHKMETTMVGIELDKEHKVAIPSEDITGEDIVDSIVSAGLLDIEPGDVLSLQDEAIQEYVESYGGLNISQDDMALVLGHVDVAKIEDSSDNVAGTEHEVGPGSEDCVNIEAICDEDFSGHEETVCGNVCTESVVIIPYEETGEDGQDAIGFDITECGDMTTKDYEEAIQMDIDILLPEGVIKEAGISFEEFESTIVEGSLTDFSQDFAASGGEELVSGEDMKLKDLREEFVAKEKLEREAASFEDFYCESLSANDHEESEFVQEFMESSHHVHCCRDVWDQSEQPIPRDNNNMKRQETDQERASAGMAAEDVLELAAEDETSERDGKQPDSFSKYRECPTLLASMDSVYESDPNDHLEKTDSESEECHGPGGSTKVQLWSYFNEPKFSVRENVEPEDTEECGENTLSESICQTDDCDTEAKDLGDHQGQATESQRDVKDSVKAELSPVTAAEEGKKP